MQMIVLFILMLMVFYTTDPSINNKGKKINKISYEEMLEMASLGAKVMQPILQDAMPQ